MARTTKSMVQTQVDTLNRSTNNVHGFKMTACGSNVYRLTTNNESVNVSPMMTVTALWKWIDAFTVGVDHEREYNRLHR